MDLESRGVQFDTVKVDGHIFVAPWLDESIATELCRPLKEYFPNNDPNLWVSWGLDKQNKWIVESLFAGRCAFAGLPMPGEYVGGHHIIKRSIGHKAACAPWNVIPVLHSPNDKRNIHGHLHPTNGIGLEIWHYDPLDHENGLAVLDRRDGGHRIPNCDLEFYSVPSKEKAAAADEYIRMCLSVFKQYVQCGYQMGVLAEVGVEHAVTLGHKTVNACLSAYGISVPPFQLGARVIDTLPAFIEEAKKYSIPLTVMDTIRKMPEEKQRQFFDLAVQRCAPLDLDDPDDRRHPSYKDWDAERKEAIPPAEKIVNCTVFDKDAKYEEEKLGAREIMKKKETKLVIQGSPVKNDQ